MLPKRRNIAAEHEALWHDKERAECKANEAKAAARRAELEKLEAE